MVGKRARREEEATKKDQGKYINDLPLPWPGVPQFVKFEK
jgi:hypothetical protein